MLCYHYSMSENILDKEGICDKTVDIEAPSAPPPPKTIKHVICSGGGVTGLCFYGALKSLNTRGIWSFNNLQSIYGTSVGALISTIICLDYDWETLDTYLIKRPWENVFKMDMYTILDSFTKKGVFDYRVFVEIFSPLFKGKDISLDVTMSEFFEITGKELHIYVVEVNRFEVVDISYKTHPEWKVLESVYTSCAIPLIFAPFFKDDQCFCDGGVLMNYPVEYCISNGADIDEILGIKGYRETSKNITPDHSLFDYIIHFANKTHKRLLQSSNDKSITHEILIPIHDTTIQRICDIALSMDERVALIEEGVKITENFVSLL